MTMGIRHAETAVKSYHVATVMGGVIKKRV